MFYNLFLSFVLFFSLSNVVLANQNYTPIDGRTKPNLSPAEVKAFCAYKDGDLVIGNPKNATITVTGYTSFSCPHCGQFVNEIMPKLKKEYFENKSKKIIYIYRTFPMSIADVKAKMLVGCGNMKERDSIRFVEMLYLTASTWVHSPKFEQKLAEITRLFGVSDKDIYTCLGSKAAEDKILQERLAIIAKTNLTGVPLIAVNGKIINGYSYKAVADAIEDELKLLKSK